ncbi:hypothetical protein niasHT_001105 [Heterodera trifolii]|uniref:Uncharacterized protein n=1 Tax=Heterodera trifolii TaxID=157864 RepID=A0ABD2LN89_9BILA
MLMIPEAEYLALRSAMNSGDYLQNEKASLDARISQNLQDPGISEDLKAKRHDWLYKERRTDWTPAHEPKTSIQLSENLFHGFLGQDIWPSNLPNLNALDISSWSFMDQSLYKRLASNNALKEAFQRTWDEIAEKRGADIWVNFRMPLDTCISARNGYIGLLVYFSNK